MNLLTTNPETRINDNFVVENQQILSLLSRTDSNEVFSNFRDDEDNVYAAGTNLHQSAFLQVVTETVFDYPHNCYSEKTWKPIVNLRPFVIAGVPGSLSDLHNHGFETFSTWWDESYDTIDDSAERLLAIVDIVEYVASKSIVQLQKILVDMQPILEYNRHHYYSKFKSYYISQLHANCQQNLLPR